MSDNADIEEFDIEHAHVEIGSVDCQDDDDTMTAETDNE